MIRHGVLSVLVAGSALSAQVRPKPAAPVSRIQAAWISAHIRFLADRYLEGRETGKRGAEIAARYVAAQFEALGLAPLGADSSLLLPVPLRYSELDPAGSTLELAGPSGARTLEPTIDYLIHADKTRDSVDVAGEVVFVGWGVTAPGRGYDDYRGVDVRGKIVAMVFGGPPSLPPDERGHFASMAVKERNALVHGAIGVVTLMPAPGPKLGRGLGQLEGFDWPDAQGQARSPFFEAGVVVRLTDRGTEALFESAGRSFPEVAAALAKGQVTFPTHASLHLRARFRHRPVIASNTAALLEGSDPRLKHEYLVYSAHMDHIGVGEPVDGDSVYHGAIDNAGGTAVMMAVARAFATGPRPRRSIIFLAVTGEEKGILGSDYFVHHPPVPIEQIVADVNLDNFVLTDPVKDLVAYGAAYSTLDSVANRVIRGMGLGVSEDALPWMTIFTRSDHYTFMRRGVPAVMLFPGKASGLGTQTGVEAQRAWFDHIHHTPRDRFDQAIDWKGAVLYGEANLRLGYAVANASGRPSWRGTKPWFFREP